MTRPAAIARFETLWWGSLVVWVGATALAWRRTQYVLESNAASRPAAGFVQPVTVALVVALTLVLWFLAARRASNVARWIAVVVAVLAALRVVLLLVGSVATGMAAPVTVGLFVLAAVLDVAAVVHLFHQDAAEWFDPFDADDSEIVE